jgi:hypothetical protein
VLSKSTKKAAEPDEQIIIKFAVAIVKDLVTKDVGDEHIVFCEDANNILIGVGKHVFLLFLSGLEIIAIMVYVTLVPVQVPFL